MKTILVPVDYSVNSIHALNYASILNDYFKAEIILFHAILVPVYSAEVPLAAPSNDTLINEATEKLSSMCKEFEGRYPGISYKASVSLGTPTDEILSAETTNKADMIIMGTKGASGLREIFLGSNAAAVAEDSTIPVITVPENSDIRVPQKVVFATNYGDNDFSSIGAVIDFVRSFQAGITLVHVTPEKEIRDFEYAEIETLAERMRQENEYPHLKFKLLSGHDPYEELNTYLKSSNADMLALSMREKRSWLFSRSLSKKMVYHSDIPLMIFHT